MAELLIHPGAFDSFALVLDEKDTLSGLRSRIAKKLSFAEGAADHLVLEYDLDRILYTLDDGAWNVGHL
jgi:hypothetical protein